MHPPSLAGLAALSRRPLLEKSAPWLLVEQASMLTRDGHGVWLSRARSITGTKAWRTAQRPRGEMRRSIGPAELQHTSPGEMDCTPWWHWEMCLCCWPARCPGVVVCVAALLVCSWGRAVAKITPSWLCRVLQGLSKDVSALRLEKASVANRGGQDCWVSPCWTVCGVQL